MTVEPGTTIGSYRVLEQIGRGGMATVYKAYQAALSRNVALKILPSYLADDEVFRERFRAEAVTVAKLRHPNILAVHDFGTENGVHYIVTEFVDGGTLADQLGSPLPPEYVARMLTPVASALDYAHARDVVHRDVKPSNVLIARDGTPVVSDFGLARMLQGSLPRLTQTGALVGTPEYMAPEQAAGETAGPASDRYALAVMAYEMVVGTVPYSADTPLATLLAHLHKPLPLPREKNPKITSAVEAVLLRGLAKAPDDRFPSATEFVRALDAAEAQTAPTIAPRAPQPAAAAPLRAPAVTPAPTAVAPRPSAAATDVGATPAAGLTRRQMLIGGAVGLFLVGGTIASYLLTREPESPPLSVSVVVDDDVVLLTTDVDEPEVVTVTVNYSNNRDALLTDVKITLRPMNGAFVDDSDTDVEETPNGIVFDLGDIGPWAGGAVTVDLAFTAPGSRVVQATITAKELPTGFTSNADTISVVGSR
jgi:tRNA A-37 threonylcarbamoyl transferase component Bud32